MVDNRLKETDITIPLGITEDGTMLTLDLYKTPHLLVAGKPQASAKSFLRGIADFLLKEYSSNEISLVLILNYANKYENSPLLAMPIGDDHKTVWEVISFLKKELNRRLDQADSQGMSNWKRLVFICDDYEKLHSSWYEEKSVLADIVRRGGEVGITAIFGVNVYAQPLQLDINCPTKLVFPVDRPKESKILLDSSLAAKIGTRKGAYYKANAKAEIVFVEL